MLDIPRQHLIVLQDGAITAVELRHRVTAVVPAADGWLAIGGRTLYRLDDRTGALDPVLAIEGPADVQLNDAVSGRDGRLYTGSVDRTQAARGELYAVDAQLQVTTVATGLGAANGIDTSPDGDVVVFADTFGDVVHVGPDGPALGVPHPDGLVVDAEGGIWVASWGHGRILRFDPSMQLDRVLEVPAVNVASLAFGGPDLDLLFVTTARSGQDGGQVFVGRPGPHGLPTQRFRFSAAG